MTEYQVISEYLTTSMDFSSQLLSQYLDRYPQYQRKLLSTAIDQVSCSKIPDQQYLVEPGDDNLIAMCRAFWRRIYPSRNNYEQELPDPLPIEFLCHIKTASTWLGLEKYAAGQWKEYPQNKSEINSLCIVERSSDVVNGLIVDIARYTGSEWKRVKRFAEINRK